MNVFYVGGIVSFLAVVLSAIIGTGLFILLSYLKLHIGVVLRL